MHFETPTRYVKRLKREGVQTLGEGAYARVFQHPSRKKVAVKVLLESDPDYIKYAEIAMQTTNPWFPRVHKIHEVQYRHCTNHILFMEKLCKASVDDVKRATQQIVADISSLEQMTSFVHFGPGTWKRVLRRTTDPHIKELASVMVKLNCGDFHDDNVMMRGNQLVFTDPVAS
jgi:hypothetical protein